jgi:hypothetical protein
LKLCLDRILVRLKKEEVPITLGEPGLVGIWMEVRVCRLPFDLVDLIDCHIIYLGPFNIAGEAQGDKFSEVFTLLIQLGLIVL